jgi:hypothetical protein
MVDHRPHHQSYGPDNDEFDEDLTDHRVAPYKFGQSARTGFRREDSVPLFLADRDGEPDPSEYMAALPMDRRPSVSSRILAGVLATAAVALLFALFSSDATREFIVNAKASITAVPPAPSAAASQNSSQLTARDTQLKDPTRLSAPANQTPGVRSVATVAVAPTRAEITTAYQSALQARAPAAAAPAAARPVAAAAPVAAVPDAASPVARPVAASPVAPPPVAAPPARRLDADELATLMNRAKGLLAAGDIPPARLLLERAADAQEPSAALMLARTYDPDVLGPQDARNIIPDPAMARLWYQKAAQFGSADAERRLTQLQN